MAIFRTLEMLGTQPVPVPLYVGELVEVTFKFDTSVTANNLGTSDFIQLMQIPGDCVITDIKLGVSATIGSTTLAVGIADAYATTTISTTFIAAAAITSTAVTRSNSLVMADTPVASPTADQRILVIGTGAEAETSATIYCAVTYRNARYGK